MTGQVIFVKVNARLNSHLSVRFGIHTTPIFISIKKGEVVEKLVGEHPKKDLQRTVDRYL